MSIVDHNQDFVVPYTLDDAWNALKKALPKLPSFKIDNFDEITKTAHIKAGVSLFSWGENMSISLFNALGGSNVSILSTPKTGVMLGGAMDFGKNRRNIDAITRAFSAELQNYPQIQANGNGQNQTSQPVDTEREIRKLKSLLDDGIITQGEVDLKKRQILGL